MTPQQAYRLCRKHGRKAELEKIIIKDPQYAYRYARDIIKGRWIEAEDVISTSSMHAYSYAKDVIQGKLPENMHNAMILHGITNPNDRNIKTYLKYKKYKLEREIS
jgi:hypothetical protein